MRFSLKVRYSFVIGQVLRRWVMAGDYDTLVGVWRELGLVLKPCKTHPILLFWIKISPKKIFKKI